MLTIKKLFARGAIAALLGATAIAATTVPASAYVVCDRYGDCYNVRPHRHYWPRDYSYYGSDYYGQNYYGQQYGPSITFGLGFGGDSYRDHDRGDWNRDGGDRGGWDHRGGDRGEGDNRGGERGGWDHGGGHDHH